MWKKGRKTEEDRKVGGKEKGRDRRKRERKESVAEERRNKESEMKGQHGRKNEERTEKGRKRRA